MDAVYSNIEKVILTKEKDYSLLRDYFSLVVEWEKVDFKGSHEAVKRLGDTALDVLKQGKAEEAEAVYDIWKRSLLFDAPYNVDAFMRYIELNRSPEKRFYDPRREYLKPMVNGYQKVLDGELKLLTISMPKRCGKSQTGINFCNLMAGKYPNKSILMEGAGAQLVDSFWKGCLEYWESDDYLIKEVFPKVRVVQTNADTRIINMDKKSRFPTIMCRSLDAIQVGLSEASNVLYLDDCVEGREEGMNRARLDAKWERLYGDVVGRAIEGTPIIMCGTRYSLYDPIGRMQSYAEELGWKWEAIEIPALDPITDESNYEHIRDGKKVFTTAYFREQRSILTSGQWESEFQQQPFEEKGLLLNPKELNYYNELPADVDPDTIIAVCDTAESGEDSTAMPIAYIYGDDIYIEDVVFDSSTPEVTKPECANKLMKHKVVNCTFESNNAGSYFARDVEEIIKSKGGKVGIRTKRTISNKQTRIEFASDNIKRHFWFKDVSKMDRTSQYYQFYKECVSYTRIGNHKKLHDDAIDSLSLLENEIRNSSATVEIVRRFF